MTGLPARVTATFGTNPVTPTSAGAPTTLRVSAAAGAMRGTYPLTITATGKDGAKHTTTVRLIIR